jgi:hypothetical protein
LVKATFCPHLATYFVHHLKCYILIKLIGSSNQKEINAMLQVQEKAQGELE